MAREALRFLSKTAEIMARAGVGTASKAATRASPMGVLAAVSDVLGAVQAGLDYSATKVRTSAAREEIVLLEQRLVQERDALKEEAALANREFELHRGRLEPARRLVDLAAKLVQDATEWLSLLLEEDIPDREELEYVQEMLEEAWEQLGTALTGWKELGGVPHG